jgi:hypothetical protein
LGGLFDIGNNDKGDWRPLDKPLPNSGIGHWGHRRGVDVDLSRLSVPLSGRCGPRPTKGTFDPVWKKTALWKQDFLLDGIGLDALDVDPGHLTED